VSQTRPRIHIIVYRLITIVLGAIFVAAGTIKGADLNQFALQIEQYGILPDGDHLSLGLAWVMVVLEIAIGSALIVNWRPKAALAMYIGLLLIFIFVLIWGLAHDSVSDCGCFGPAARRSPVTALIEDALMLLGALVAWRLRAATPYLHHRFKGLTVAATCLLAMILPWTMGAPHVKTPVAMPQASEKLTEMIVKSTAGERIALDAGVVLLALMSTNCVHCSESVPLLNEIVAEAEDTIAVYGVAAEDQLAIDRFVEDTFAFYPVLPVEADTLSSLMSDAPLPQYLFYNNGKLIARWQGKPPELEALMNLATTAKGA
jgi:uncharacterized membrane protein YphA (DoxX/SURF4 family)/thiol-disulfide isomerase/thioredoxin